MERKAGFLFVAQKLSVSNRKIWAWLFLLRNFQWHSCTLEKWCLRETQHTPGAYPRHPQTPKWKEFLHKLLVGGMGYAPGVCWKVLRWWVHWKKTATVQNWRKRPFWKAAKTRFTWIFSWFHHQLFQVPKMEVLSLIRLFWGWVFPYISLTYCLYRWVPPF